MNTWLARVRERGEWLDRGDVDLQANMEVVMAAVKQNGHALAAANPSIQDKYKEVVMAAVNRNGCAMVHKSSAMKANPEVVLAAVQQDGRALQHADIALKVDRNVE